LWVFSTSDTKIAIIKCYAILDRKDVKTELGAIIQMQIDRKFGWFVIK